MQKLEDLSLWYKYKEQVWPTAGRADLRDDELLNENQKTIHNVMRVMRCISSPELAYLSCPITSGKELYERLQSVESVSDQKKIKGDFIAENFAKSYQFFEGLRSRTATPLLYPALYEPAWQKWEQPHFQALWLNIIGEKVTEMHMAPGWEYSTGASEELTHAFQLGLGIPESDRLVYERKVEKLITVHDSGGNQLTVEQSLGKIDDAISYIEGLGFQPEKLIYCRDVLEKTRQALELKGN